ncbi:MAG TPA: flagellin [Burkholderiaceae bacterium]|nr:flagellin [Burkholderiaceae bacterium]
MPAIINTNLMSLNAQRNLNASQSAMATAVQRLSSGLRINSAKDDAAGLAISQRMTAQINGMNVAIRNSNDAISMSQVADGALGTVGDMLQQMRELAVQSANQTNGAGDRANLQAEFAQLGAEITRELGNTKFNGLAILGADAGAQQFQVGANATDTISVTTTQLDNNAAITAVTGADISTSQASASAAIGLVDTALDTINGQRALYGATQNRFESVVNGLQINVENQTAARSRITDTDFAAETAELTRDQILQQAGTAMLAQANAQPQNVLALLK